MSLYGACDVLFNITKPLKLIIYLIIIFKLLFLYGVRGCVAEVIMMIAEVNHKKRYDYYYTLY